MRHHALLVMTLGSALFLACSDDSGGGGTPAAGAGGAAAGSGGAAGTGGSATTSSGGASGGTATPPAPPLTPALAPGAPTVSCPTTINGSLDASDRTQTGRHSRVTPVSACGMTKASPGNAADPSNPHLYDVYRFANPGSATACFTFTLSDGSSAVITAVDAGLDAGSDASSQDAGLESNVDAGSAAGDAAVVPVPIRYLTAYGTFYPTDITQAYLGDVGDKLDSPQTMGITVPAGGTIDVVIYGVDVAPGDTGAYTLSCSTQ